MSLARVAPALVALGACSPDYAGPIAVLARADDGSYGMASVEIDGFDAARVAGPLGTGRRGGALTLSGYHRGGDVTVHATRADGTWIPDDEDGLVLWSFYHDLDEAQRALTDEAGADLSPVFPVDIAWNPASIYDFAAAENAAYASGLRLFLLMPDALDGVPLPANAGVVRHELGHAWFEVLVTGTAGGPDPTANAGARGIAASRALNEGWADTVASLSLDDPDFIGPSLHIPERVVGNPAAIAASDVYPPADITDLDVVLGVWDPYVLGSVYASFAWDVAVITGDRWATLRSASEAVGDYGAAGDWEDTDAFVRGILERVPSAHLTAACADAGLRFPEATLEPACP